MHWYHYVASFFAGVFLTNMIPHFVNGVSGNRFPTPFAKPPGRGLSSPLLNVIWALFNLIVGCLLFDVAKISKENLWSIAVFFLGILLMSIELASASAKKHHA